MASTSAQPHQKRKAEDILVDPDTSQETEVKKPKIALSTTKKFACLSSIVKMHSAILDEAFPPTLETATATMDIDPHDTSTIRDEAALNITIGNYIIGIIFKLHNVNRQNARAGNTDMIKNTAETSYKVQFKGQDYPLDTAKITALWLTILQDHGLEYNDYVPNDDKNWYHTMRLYLEMFTVYSLRVNEIRLGHNNMLISKVDGTFKTIPVAKYGLNRSYSVLLEGISYPPERRSFNVQSLGPMTAWLCMLRSSGVYRKKYAAAVKRAMSYVPCIDDLIEITKSTLEESEVATITTLIAEILMLTTARQAARMFFPITIFSAVWRPHTDSKKLCEFFSCTGSGGWYVYKLASEMEAKFTVAGGIEEEMASQIVFHSIFGTFKEDLGVLEDNQYVWFTREELRGCLKIESSPFTTIIKLPLLKYYAELLCLHQNELYSECGYGYQVATVSCFSGYRVQQFSPSFFEHIEKRRVMGSGRKGMNELRDILMKALDALHEHVSKNKEMKEVGTIVWRRMGDLSLGNPGSNVDMVFSGRLKMSL